MPSIISRLEVTNQVKDTIRALHEQNTPKDLSWKQKVLFNQLVKYLFDAHKSPVDEEVIKIAKEDVPFTLHELKSVIEEVKGQLWSIKQFLLIDTQKGWLHNKLFFKERTYNAATHAITCCELLIISLSTSIYVFPLKSALSLASQLASSQELRSVSVVTVAAASVPNVTVLAQEVDAAVSGLVEDLETTLALATTLALETQLCIFRNDDVLKVEEDNEDDEDAENVEVNVDGIILYTPLPTVDIYKTLASQLVPCGIFPFQDVVPVVLKLKLEDPTNMTIVPYAMPVSDVFCCANFLYRLFIQSTSVVVWQPSETASPFVKGVWNIGMVLFEVAVLCFFLSSVMNTFNTP